MVTLHYLKDSRAQRILWMLEELGIAYDVQQYERDPHTELAPEPLKRVHPLGKSPVITHGDITLAESGAIIDYLAAEFSPRWAASHSPKAHQQYRYWLHFAEGSFMPWLLMSLVFERIKDSPMPFFAKPIAKAIVQKVMGGLVTPNVVTALEYIEDHLSTHEWFAGDEISGADCQMSFPLEAANARGLLTDDQHPATKAYLKRISQRPAYQRALGNAGEYAYAQVG